MLAQVELKPVGEIIKWVDELDGRHLLEILQPDKLKCAIFEFMLMLMVFSISLCAFRSLATRLFRVSNVYTNSSHLFGPDISPSIPLFWP